MSFEPRLFEGIPSDFPNRFAVHARHADLVILGQPEEGDSWSTRGELISRVLYASGRPVLIVPYIGAPGVMPKKIMAAWDASAQAARAFHDALPLLRKAQEVLVATARPEKTGDIYAGTPGLDISRHLARHGVNAQVMRLHGEQISVGNMLLSRLADEGADMLVMGAFHHSRLREQLIGGVTRTMIEHMTTPVFMAH